MSERDELRAALRGGQTAGTRTHGEHPDENELVDLIEDRLPAAARPRVEAHVAACDDCAAIVALELRRSEEATPPAPARARVRWRRIVLAGAIAAGAALAFGPGVLIPAGGLSTALADGASRYLGRTTSIGGAAVRLGARPGVRLTQIRLGGSSGATGDVLAADRLDVKLLPGDLFSGRLALDVALERPIIKLQIDDAGIWNIEGIGRHPTGRAPVGGEHAPPAPDASGIQSESTRPRTAWRLADGEISGGRIEIATPRHDGPRSALVLDPVAASFTSNPSDPRAAGQLRLDASLEPASGPAGSIALAGTAGPFDGTRGPRWDLSSVRLAALPIEELPGAPSAITGSLEFVGSLASTARDTGSIPTHSTGAGRLTVDDGLLRGRNLARDLVAALGEADGAEASSWTRAVAAALATEPEIAMALAAPDTRFRRLAARTRLEAGTLELDGLELRTELFEATGSGSVAWSGSMSAEGGCEFSPRLATALVGAAPRLGALRDAAGRLHVPFAVAGRWPDIRLHVELDHGIAMGLPSSWAAATWLALATRTATGPSASRHPARDPTNWFGGWAGRAGDTLPGSDPRG